MTRKTMMMMMTTKSNGYKGFGSFMSDNIMDMIDNCKNKNHIDRPEIPFQIPKQMNYDPKRNVREYFAIDFENFTFINHGAFGGALINSLEMANAWRYHAETQPLRYFDRTLFPHMVYSAWCLSRFLGTSVNRIALVQNATAGLDAVIASHASAFPNKKAVYFNIAYGSVKKMIRRHFGENCIEITIPRSMFFSPACTFCEFVHSELDKIPKDSICLGIMDHIASNTAFVLPLDKIAKIFHDHNIPVLVDGAHGPLACDLDLDSLDVEYYVGNTHKWLSSPKSVGFLHIREATSWMSKKAAPRIIPRITSHGFDTEFPECFYFDGCRDYAGVLALPEVLNFWNAYGVKRARAHNCELVQRAAYSLADAWNTNVSTSEFTQGPMIGVPLPENLGNTSDDAYKIQNFLYHEQRIECPIKADGERLYARISSQIYNCIDDYEKLARGIKSIE